MGFYADRCQQFREPSVIQCFAVTGTFPEPTPFSDSLNLQGGEGYK